MVAEGLGENAMRLKISRSKNSASLYVMKSTYINKVHSTKIVEKLGTYADLKEKLNGQDPIEWANEYIQELNRKEKEERREIKLKFLPAKQIIKGNQRAFNGGYLFLQKIYCELGIPKICIDISQRHKFLFNLDSIMSRLIFGRVIYPSSKLATYELAQNFIQQPDFELQHVYRALEIMTKETDLIQSTVYQNSLKKGKRNTGILYYDCTNYFFEIEQEDGIRQYGLSKEHRPNPIVQMGLFMDGDGIPLAFSMNAGNTNEQVTLQPLEERIISDYQLSKFVVCTDAGLASTNNRKFNNINGRAFITTQSIKKLKKFLKEWALDSKDWSLPGKNESYDISKIDEETHKDKTFYKERWINEDNIKQRLIVTFSIKYRDYQRQIRERQINRAENAIKSGSAKIKKCNANDYKRLIKKTHCTENGEIAEKQSLSIDQTIISDEILYDGFYATCTNLVDEADSIIEVNKKRWEIEECFRIMKSEFKARPIFLSREDRIKAHFLTCYLSLIVFRLLEKRLNSKYTCAEIVQNLRNMNFYEVDGEGYVPTYTRNDFTDDLHNAFGFRTDYQIMTNRQLKKIIKMSKT